MYIYQYINMSKKVLVVEDEIELLDFYDKMLTAEDYTVYRSETGKKAIDIFDKEDPKIIIMYFSRWLKYWYSEKPDT